MKTREADALGERVAALIEAARPHRQTPRILSRAPFMDKIPLGKYGAGMVAREACQ